MSRIKVNHQPHIPPMNPLSVFPHPASHRSLRNGQIEFFSGTEKSFIVVSAFFPKVQKPSIVVICFFQNEKVFERR